MPRLYFVARGMTAPHRGGIVSGTLVVVHDDNTITQQEVKEEVALKAAEDAGVELLPYHPYVHELAEEWDLTPEEADRLFQEAIVTVVQLENTLSGMGHDDLDSFDKFVDFYARGFDDVGDLTD